MDFETTGLDPLTDTIVGVGIADEAFPMGIYFCMKEPVNHKSALMKRISQRPKIAHNFTFELIMEEMWWRNLTTLNLYNNFSNTNYKYCTSGLLNQLEGDYAGLYQQNGLRGSALKNLQTAALGWPEAGDIELDEWLINNGYHDKEGKPLKGEMHRAPTSILGHYCGLDAQSTWMLYKHFYGPKLNDFPELDLYHSRDYMNLGKLTVEQRLRGMKINTEGLQYYIRNLEWLIENSELAFMQYSSATPHIETFNQAFRDALFEKQPKRTTAKGDISKNWLKWEKKCKETQDTNYFKITSKTKDLPWLLYDCLFKTTKRIETNWRGETKHKMDIIVEDGTATVDCNNEKHRPVDLEILPRLGDVGQILYEYSKLTKEVGYVRSMLESTVDGIHYPQLRLGGTKTDRCAGTGGVNIQQQPKTYDYMKCFTHRKGMKLMQMDIDALEAVVLGELSEDKAYMKLYGPDAVKGNDVYLFVGSGLGDMGRDLLEFGYDPNNPDPDIVKAAKKKFKGQRAVFKKFHLSGQYGAGAGRIWRDLVLQGIDIDLDTCKKMHKDYWILFEDVIVFTAGLQKEVDEVGYFIDGIGTPVTVDERFSKDTLNRCIQRTGHMILVKYLYHLEQIRKERNLIMYPIIDDFHDETVWEFHDGDEQIIMEAFNEAWKRTNKELGGIIPLSGAPEICTSWADFKCEEPRGIL